MKQQKKTLCWECENAVPCNKLGTGCSWSEHFIPVKGWKATYESWDDDGCYIESYCVQQCPKFIGGHDSTKNQKRNAKRWSAWELHTLKQMLFQGQSYDAIARKLSRKKNSIWQRVCRMKREGKLPIDTSQKKERINIYSEHSREIKRN